MGLNANQKRAVEYLEGPLLVLAGPGTGKTQLLSHKVAYILENTDTNPENILCLTFTDTGAANMRERLKSIIGRDALKVNIGTYHVFGSEILAQYKNYTENYDRRLDASIDEVMQFKIVKSLQDNLPGTDILRGDQVKDIIGVISDAKSAGFTADDLEKVALLNIEDSEVISSAISPLLLNVVPRVFKESYDNAYRPIYEILAKYAEATSLALEKPPVERTIAILARELKAAMLEAESEQKIKPLSNWKDSFFEKDFYGNYRLKDRIANKKLLSIARLMRDYENYLTENGLFDFDDMILEAVKALQTDEGFRQTLQERYQFIMLDEFQDTNPAQLAIVKEITRYEKPMIMAVGDDDQAIYEFQGALSSNLADFQDYYGAEVIPLVENYRSTQEILDFSHEIIRQAPDRFGDKELVAHKENPAKSQIERREFISSEAEYAFIADKIAELIRSGVKQSEIAVISYKTKYFTPLLPYLKAHPEIMIAYEKRDNLFEDEKIHEILTMAQYIVEMSSGERVTAPILEILAYPFFGLSVLEVVKCVRKAQAEHKSTFEALAESENQEIREVMSWFSELIARSTMEPLTVILDMMMRRMGVKEMSAYEKFKFYENIASLTGKTARHFGEKSLKLCDLVEMVRDFEAADMALSTTSPYKDSADAVQIMTAHKAKGLEFEYVFIISTDNVAWGKGKGNNSLLSLPKNMMQIRHTGTTDGERLRILYVALTRAKQALYLTNSVTDFNGKNPARLEYLDEHTEGDEVISPFLPNKKVILDYDVAPLEAMSENLRNWLLPYYTEAPEMREIYLEKVRNFRMSASALTSFIDVVYAGPQAFFNSYILQAPREPETEALAFGDLIHKTFEAVTNQGLSDTEAVEYFLAEAEKKSLPVDVLGKIRERGAADLLTSLAKFGEIVRRGKAEVNMSSERLVVDGVPVTGKIDHIIIDEEKKVIEVYDFKTGGFHKEKWGSHPTLYKYMLQLLFYKMLLNNSREYGKYKIERAHILFVTPDRDGEVYDKVYEYDEKDEAEFRKLLKSVYSLVEDLSFMDDAEVFIEADDGRKLADIKDFIALVLAKSEEK
ncbi:ATP-dependent helicase [Candidatus Saccharibacteria bacterium]|nr:ATP-dependent helicase [Candidatus Saccharibacteria bacterium]